MSDRPRREDEPADWPDFCCAILRDCEGRYLLEQRPAHDADAPGRLTCFGGGREPGEHPDTCVRRELVEELGLVTNDLEVCVRLMGPNERVIAWFYRGVVPRADVRAVEHGIEAVWAAWEQFDELPVGDWNLAAIIAERRGERVAWV